MGQVGVVPEAVETFGATAAALATATGTAGGLDLVGSGVLTAVFGLIGQEFLLAYGGAQANHLFGVGALSAVHAATAVTAGTALADFVGADSTGAGEVLSI